MEPETGAKGTSLEVQWLRFHASNARGTSLIPGWGNKIPHVTRPKETRAKTTGSQELMEERWKQETKSKCRCCVRRCRTIVTNWFSEMERQVPGIGSSITESCHRRGCVPGAQDGGKFHSKGVARGSGAHRFILPWVGTTPCLTPVPWHDEIKRHLLLRRKTVTNLDSVFKSRDITLPTKIHVVKAMVFPIVTYRYESCTIKKAEHQRIDAFELWCWRRLLRVPWTARRSNQSILKEINPEYSLEGLMLKPKLQYFDHLMRRAESLEKNPDAGKD